MSYVITLPPIDVSVDVSEWYVREWKNDVGLYRKCEQLLQDIPERRAGLYFLYANDVLLYIGRSINLRQRIVDHLVRGDAKSKGYANDVTRVDCIFIEDICDQEIYEAYAIKIMKPVHNKAKTEKIRGNYGGRR
jgi:excinuclease UvrABC nuclease subunit